MNLLLVIHVFITIILIAVILLQKTENSGGLVGGSSSGSGSMFSARGAANLLTRITAVLAVLFIGNCILMTIMTSAQLRQSTSFLDTPDSTTRSTPTQDTPSSSEPAKNNV